MGPTFSFQTKFATFKCLKYSSSKMSGNELWGMNSVIFWRTCLESTPHHILQMDSNFTNPHHILQMDSNFTNPHHILQGHSNFTNPHQYITNGFKFHQSTPIYYKWIQISPIHTNILQKDSNFTNPHPSNLLFPCFTDIDCFLMVASQVWCFIICQELGPVWQVK